MTLVDWINQNFFHAVHRNNLVYAACWEDPRVDRAGLQIGPDDNVLVITSAGCNALDYALDAPHHIYAVDINFRQNALLELKLACIRELDYDTFFAMFGKGCLPGVQEVYRARLRSHLPEDAMRYWDRSIKMFGNRRRPFYFHGSSGTFAWMMSWYVKHVAKLEKPLLRLLEGTSTREQWKIYTGELRDKFWKPWVKWGLANPGMLAISGVPRPQVLLARRSPETIAEHMQRCTEYCITQQPMAENYFWRVYLTGQFTPECCPEYLKPENFARLKNGLIDRITTHTASVSEFLKNESISISRFVLLDHFDWFYQTNEAGLEDEWNAMLSRATPDARWLWRSMGTDVDFVNRANVHVNGEHCTVGDAIEYDELLAKELFAKERTRTYQSLRIAQRRRT